MSITKKSIDRAIKHLGLEIVKGHGYSYFLELHGPKKGEQVGESVMVCYLSQQSIQEWVKDAEAALEEQSERKASLPAGEEKATTPNKKGVSKDFSIFQGGKHLGETVREVFERDKEYLLWFCERTYPHESDQYKTQMLAKQLLEAELQEVRTGQLAISQELKAEVGEANLNSWKRGDYGPFLRTMALVLQSGNMPRGKGLQMVLDAVAKAHAKSGTKRHSERKNCLYAKFLR